MKNGSGMLTLAVGVPLLVSAQQPTYFDPSAPLDGRIDDLVQRLTLPDIRFKSQFHVASPGQWAPGEP